MFFPFISRELVSYCSLFFCLHITKLATNLRITLNLIKLGLKSKRISRHYSETLDKDYILS